MALEPKDLTPNPVEPKVLVALPLLVAKIPGVLVVVVTGGNAAAELVDRVPKEVAGSDNGALVL